MVAELVGVVEEKRRERKGSRLWARGHTHEVPLSRGREHPLPLPVSLEELERGQPQREAAGGLEDTRHQTGVRVGSSQRTAMRAQQSRYVAARPVTQRPR